MSQVRCPVCGKRFESDTSPAMPFCGQRCRAIDLNRWLAEENRVPIEREEECPEDFGVD